MSDKDFKTVDEVVQSIDDLFDMVSDILGEDDFFLDDDIECATSEEPEESPDDAYDRAMKGV